jgi:uncharacterized protein (DUF1800 family)
MYACGWRLRGTAIRPHALGKFRELLTASMRHPAMLLYLDNASNAAGRINENYARELLELHTMGVGSGYTQADVQAMAHVLTGVGFSTREADARRPSCAPNARATTCAMASSNSTPTATTTPPGLARQAAGKSGLAQVNEAVDRIVASPVTARFIARKLCPIFSATSRPQPWSSTRPRPSSAVMAILPPRWRPC